MPRPASRQARHPPWPRPSADLEFPSPGDAETLDLRRFFAVTAGGHLTAQSGVRVRVDGDRLFVTPNDVGEDGTAVITVTATEFAVTVDPPRGFWQRWGFRVIGEAKQSPNEG